MKDLTSNDRAFALLLQPVMRKLGSCYPVESTYENGKLDILWEGGVLATLTVDDRKGVQFSYAADHWLPNIGHASVSNPVCLPLSEAFAEFERLAQRMHR